MKRTFPLLLIVLTLASACSAPASGGTAGLPNPNPATRTPILLPTDVPPAILQTLQPSPTPAPSFTPIPTFTPVPSATVRPLPTATATLTIEPSAPSLALVHQGPGTVVCPILLYHHIEIPKYKDPYYVRPDDFRAQMQALKDWGYTSITATQLVEAINSGADLPARPIVLSFDDGDESVYTTAFPILKEMGFIGVNYIITTYIGKPTYLTVDEIKEMDDAGWEVGSHSMTHPDLTTSANIEWEMVQSKIDLKKLLHTPITTFAYPYGRANLSMYDLLMKNYQAGMGLGISYTQRTRDLWYLWRRPVELGVSLETFATYLPWNSPP